MGEILLQMRGIQKYFPGVHALDDCHFELKSGEVHALVGENGAGKSTMMKVLTGVYQMDAGEILLDGKPVQIHNTRDAQALGISIIHQELNLMKDLTVAENIYIGREPMNGILLNKRRQNEMAAELLSSLSIDISPTTIVGTLTVARQQMVEIAKALSYDNTRILIMDEPSAALTESEIEELFRFIRDLKARGVGIVYISHRMGELKQISDRITVMRDGQYIGTVNTAEVTMDEIIRMMVGRVIYEQPKEKSNVPPDAPIVLEAKHLLSKDVKDVSFVLHKGEILGFAGLMGAGRTETARLVSGADKRLGGEILVNGREVNIQTPRTRSRPASAICPRTASATACACRCRWRTTRSWPRCTTSSRAPWSTTRRSAKSRTPTASRSTSRRLRWTPKSSPSRAATSRRSFWPSGWCAIATYSSSTSRRAASTWARRAKSTS